MAKEKKIIIVDDEQMILDMLREMIPAMLKGKMDCSILTFSNPQEVLENENDIRASSLLISDYNMPQMKGIELIECVKKINPEIKTLIISGADIRIARESAQNNIFVDQVLQKPLGWVEFKNSIINFLQ